MFDETNDMATGIPIVRPDNDQTTSVMPAPHSPTTSDQTENGSSAVPRPHLGSLQLPPSVVARRQRDSILGRCAQALERVLALIFLVLASPLLLLIALAIRIDSRGGAIFKQRRLARSGSNEFGGGPRRDQPPTFALYKFRTYRIDGDKIVPQRARFEFDPDTIDHVCLQLKDDPRITRVGRLLRRTSLDEIPNLVNVVLGEMRLIGPRPEVIEMYRYYSDEQKSKFTVRPGITGLAQVNGRGKLSFKQTVDYDLRYVREKSLLLDIWILVKTVKVVLVGDGSF